MSSQKLKGNADRFHKDKSPLNHVEVRDGNDVEPTADKNKSY